MSIPHHRPPWVPDRRTRAKQYDAQERHKDAAAFYRSKAWTTTRAAVLREEPLCRRCASQGRVTAAVIVHHLTPLREGWELRLDRSNLEPLCRTCHGQVHKEDQ